MTTLFILSSFSFENYYGVPGLARSVINDEDYEVSRKAYERQPFDPADVPTDLRKLIRAEYFDPQFFAESAYGRLVAGTRPTAGSSRRRCAISTVRATRPSASGSAGWR